MADTDLAQLNKTVTEAVNILKIYVGNSGQIKARNDQERKMLDKWLTVTDMQEDQVKRQRAFTERERDEHGRFIKKREGAWGKFLDMAEAGMKVFDKMTLGVTGKIKGMVQGIAVHFSKIFSELKSHFLSLFGEESEWFGMLSAIKDSVTGFASSIIGWIWKKTPNWAKKMISHLGAIYSLQVKQMKMDYLRAGGEKGKKVSWMGLLGALIFSIGAAIGAFMHRYFVLITKLPLFSKVAKLFTSLEALPFIGKLIKSVKFGFKWLGWPLTLILSVIDFIKGFQETEGDLWEKIKGGFWSAIEGFIELPVKFIGWVVEKVAGLFGVELEGVGEKIMGVLRKGFDFLMEINPLNPLIHFIMGFFSTEGTFMEKIRGGFTELIKVVTGIWNGVLDFIITNIPSWLPFGDKARETLLGMKAETATKPEPKRYSVADTVRETERKKLEEQKARDLEVAKGMKDMWLAQKEGNKKTQTAMNTIAAVQQNNQNGGGVGDVKQIPDEVDNQMIGMNAYGGSMAR